MHRNNNGILGGVSWTPTLPSAPGPPISPFPVFSHNQRDQLLRNNRSASAMGTVFDFRPSFIGGPLATSNVMSLPTNGMNLNCSNNFTDNLEHAIFSEEVQEEANSYFQQIYSHTGRLSVNDFIIKLKGLRDSIILRDKELLMCVVKNLFDEYKFFQEYPDRELKTTAEVYGGLIREGIISNLQLATAVRRVVEAIQGGTSRPLWDFGIVALNACRSVLHKYPKVCQMFMLSENFFCFPSILRECVTNGAQGLLPPSKAAYTDSLLYNTQSITRSFPSNGTNLSMSVSVPSLKSISNIKFSPRDTSSGGSSILNATNIDTLVKAAEREGCLIAQPSSSVYEQVSFIFNNLSHGNILIKSQELKTILQNSTDSFTQWLAQYLVMKRVTVEQNFQSLYNIFIMTINDKLLDDCIEKETYWNINILLRSDKSQAASNFGDRQLLKNLGHWLGLITIGRDRPILAKDLDLKVLLLDAFNKGQQELLYVLPFVVKTLMASSKSTIFCSRSAWVYSIIKVLSEIHNEVDLKLNLKFEIEVLCKELNIDLASVECGTYLKESSSTISNEIKLDDPGPLQELRIGNSVLVSADSKPSNTINSVKEKIDKSTEDLSTTTTDVFSLTNQRQTSSVPLITLFNYNNINIYNLEDLLQQLKEPSNSYLLQYHPALKDICKAEILHAIKELIGNIIERSINSALTATEIICCKDFAFDPTDKNIRRSSYQMMRSMTAGMAAITCREPLAATMTDFMKQALYNNIGHPSSLSSNQMKIIDETVHSITELNLEIATSFIIKSACEHGFIEIEKCLAKEFIARREAAENSHVFAPIDTKTIPMCGKLPDALRAKLGPISDAHIKIYDEFSSKICGFKPISSESITREIVIRNEVLLSNKNFTISRSIFNAPADEKCNKTDSTLDEKFRMELNSNNNKKLNQQNNISNNEEDNTRMNSDFLFEQKSDIVFRDWLQMYYSVSVQHGSMNLFSSFIELIQKHGIYINDDSIFNFFKQCIDLCLQITYRHLKNERQQQIFARQKCYVTLDGFAKMICLLVKYSDDSLTQTLKINLLRKVLSILCNALYLDHEQRKFEFNGLSFQRIFITMFNELTNIDLEMSDLMYSSIMEAFGNSLIILQPRRVSGFAFHWLDIIGHRVFIGRYLYINNLNKEKFATIYTQLLLCALKFLAPFLSSFNLSKAILYYYKGTLCLLLVILHDFPEIFCEYHYAFCNVIPPNCIQLRNIILSAYPYEMSLPDPFTQSMKVIENLPEMAVNPKMHREIANIISADLRTRLDNYLTTRTPITFLSDLPRFLHKSDVSGQKYNDIIINSFIIYIGVRAIESINERFEKISMKTIAHTSYMDIFQNLIVSFCMEGRYLLFNAIANQLRYPNTHTHYFSCVLLYLFLETNTEHVREQITRTLLERLIALRPHPWGLLTTFIELVSNSRYNFWSYDFVRCAPEIERLFLSVASSCHLDQSNNTNQSSHLVDNNNNKS